MESRERVIEDIVNIEEDIDNKEVDYDAIIIGMGPSGLMTAYQTLTQGEDPNDGMFFPIEKKILLVEKRSENNYALRPQFVVLDKDSKNTLLNMYAKNLNIDDVKFLNTITIAPEIKIGSVQKYIKRRIADLCEFYKIFNKDLQIDYLFDSIPMDCSMNEGIITIENSVDYGKYAYSFAHLVSADGASASTLNLVNDSLGEDLKIQRKNPKKISFIKDTRHMSAALRMRPVNGAYLEEMIPDKEFLAAYKHNKITFFNSSKNNLLYFLRFNKSSFLKSNGEYIKFGYVGEIKKELFEKIKKIDSETSELTDRISFHTKSIEILENNILKLQALIVEEKSYDELPQKIFENQANIFELQELINVMREDLFNLLKLRKNIVISKITEDTCAKLNINPQDIEIELHSSQKNPAKDKLKLTTFAGDSIIAERAAIEINGNYFYLIGDSYFTPLYPFGHGLNDGLRAACILGKMIGNRMDLTLEYDSTLREQANLVINRMKDLKSASAFRVANNYLAKALENAVVEFSDNNEPYLDGHFFVNQYYFSQRNKLGEPLENFIKSIKNDFSNLVDEVIRGLDSRSSDELEILLIEIQQQMDDFLSVCTTNQAIVFSMRHQLLKCLSKMEYISCSLSNTIEQHQETPGNINKANQVTHAILEIRDAVLTASSKIDNQYIEYLNNLSESEVNTIDERKKTPLYYALLNANSKAVKVLLSKGANIDDCLRDFKDFKSIFSKQSFYTSNSIVNSLVESGFNPFDTISYQDIKVIPFEYVLEKDGGVQFYLHCLLAINEYQILIDNMDEYIQRFNIALCQLDQQQFQQFFDSEKSHIYNLLNAGSYDYTSLEPHQLCTSATDILLDLYQERNPSYTV